MAGNIGNMPDRRFTAQGTSVTTFSVAVNRGKDDKKETDWYRTTCWKELADTVAETFSKGSRVKIEGRLAQKTYMDKQGQQRISMEITADSVVADSKDNTQQETGEVPF